VDLTRILRALRRFWYIAVGGAVLSVLVGVLAIYRIDSRTWSLVTRHSGDYRAAAVLLVTGPGAPELRAVPPAPQPARAGRGVRVVATTSFADPTRLDALAGLYAYFIRSDAVCSAVGGDACKPDASGHTKIDAQVLASAAAVEGTGSQSFPDGVPLIEVSAHDSSPVVAAAMANRAAQALVATITARQRRSRIPVDERAKVELNRSARFATLVAPPSKTAAIAAFLGMLLLTVALATAAANMWPEASGEEPAAGGIEPEDVAVSDSRMRVERPSGPGWLEGTPSTSGEV
jgi:hypothetical protein